MVLSQNSYHSKSMAKNFAHQEPIDHERKNRRKVFPKLTTTSTDRFAVLCSKVSYFDFKCLTKIIDMNVNQNLARDQNIHNKNLLNLGTDINHKDKVIFGHSSRRLTQKEESVLALGLDFYLKPKRLHFTRYFLQFENICRMIKTCNIYQIKNINSFINNISSANVMYTHHVHDSRAKDNDCDH